MSRHWKDLYVTEKQVGVGERRKWSGRAGIPQRGLRLSSWEGLEVFKPVVYLVGQSWETHRPV
jgi:hypothetical protein